MTVTTYAAVCFSFSFVFTRDLLTLQHTYSTYVFLGALVLRVFVCYVLLTCQNLAPQYKTTTFFQMYFQEKKNSYIRVNTVIHNS